MRHVSYYFDRKPRWLVVTGFVLLGVLAAVFFAFVFGYFVMLLWNWLMPALFGLGTITYLQAFGIIVLARLIFGSIGHRHDESKNHKSWTRFRNCGPNGDKYSAENGKRKWEYYDGFWKEEGKEAFDRYVQNKENQDEPGKE